MTSSSGEQGTDQPWFLLHELRQLPVFLVESSLKGWGDLEHLVIHRFRQGCYVEGLSEDLGDLAHVEQLVGCERLDASPWVEGDGDRMQDLILRLQPTPLLSPQPAYRGTGECLLEVSEVSPANIGTVLDGLDAAGLSRLSTWTEEGGRQWIHALAPPGRRLPRWISGVESVLHRSTHDGPFVPPGTAHPFATRRAMKFLPPCEDGEVLVWDAEEQVAGLRIVRAKRGDLSPRIDWPDLGRREVKRKPRPDCPVRVGVRLETDRRSVEARRAERCHVVMHIRVEYDQLDDGKIPPAGILDVLDDGDAGVRDLVYYCLADESVYSDRDYYFRTLEPVGPLDIHQSALTAVYVQPKRFGDFSVPVFVRLGCRLWPEVDWLLDGVSDLRGFVRELTESLNLKEGDDVIALLDAGQSPEAPRVTILQQGRPLLENIDVLLKQWRPSLVPERLPAVPGLREEAVSSGVVELDQAAKLLSGQFDAAVQSLLGELDDVLGRVDESDREARAAASRAEGLHLKAMEVFAPLGESWTKLIARLLELNKELQQERYDWVEGVESLRARLGEQFEEFAGKQEGADVLVARIREEVAERKVMLEARDRSIKGHLSHATTIEREIEKNIGPKHRERLQKLGKRVDDANRRIVEALNVIRPQREEIDQRVGALQDDYRQLESERASIDAQVRQEHELKARAETERAELKELRRLAVALNKETEQLEAKLPQIRVEVENFTTLARRRRAEADKMNAEAIAAKEAAQSESEAAVQRHEQSAKEMAQARRELHGLTKRVRDEKASADKRQDVVDRANALMRELEAVGIKKRRRGMLWRLKRMFVR